MRIIKKAAEQIRTKEAASRHLRLKGTRLVAVLGTAVVAAATVAGGVATAVPASASAGVSCYGDYCSGQDPVATGCNASAYTFASVNVGAGELDLRWSPVCKTEWARLYVFPTRELAPGVIWALQPSTGYSQTAGVGGFAGLSLQSPTYWTPMIYSPVRCVSANFNLYTGYSWNAVSTACI